ncbi:MAG: hypothetical protein CR990_00675 [Desulfococcus sp.]|nr:MAG: hypothetical protein CR990_00675 [Desulfococcus sp.]
MTGGIDQLDGLAAIRGADHSSPGSSQIPALFLQHQEGRRFRQRFFPAPEFFFKLANAVARARTALQKPDPENPGSGPSGDWHMARLWLGPDGGGTLCGGDTARSLTPHDQGHREFLDRAKQVPVATHAEFVGRRRQIQAILREFRSPTRAGVLIHGFGGQGKSSLAARIANRMEGLRPIVIFGEENARHNYRAAAILKAIRDEFHSGEITALANAEMDGMRTDPDRLTDVLRKILETSCRDSAAVPGPFLLVIDDIEKLLEPPADEGRHTVHANYVKTLCAVVSAFDRARTDSRLLLTSRYLFDLPGGQADRLLPLHLPAMQRHEQRKQADAKRRTMQTPAPPDNDLLHRVMDAARGNPRLQDLLFTLATEAPDACERALERMATALNAQGGGNTPADTPEQEAATEKERKLIAFFQGLAMRQLVELLRPVERDLLRASAVFGVPVPAKIFEKLTGDADTAQKAGERLCSLTLWERVEDMVNWRVPAAAVNGLARSLAFVRQEAGSREADDWRIPEPDEELTKAVAQTALPPLFAAWGGADGRRRPHQADWQLAVLGAAAGDAAVVRATAAAALWWLREEFRYQEAAKLGVAAVTLLDDAGVDVPPSLLRLAGERCEQVGDVTSARTFMKRAVALFESAGEMNDGFDERGYAASLVSWARRMVRDGDPDSALSSFQKAKEIYQKLGDRHQRAVTLGYIAGIRRSKGEVDAALKLQKENLETRTQLGDLDGVAAASYGIAQIEMERQEWQGATEHLSGSYAINMKLGRLDGICMVGLFLGPLLCAAGKKEEGMEILTRSRDGFLKLGWQDHVRKVEEIMAGIS